MSQSAKIGDTIVITNPASNNNGGKFTVVECPYSGDKCECKNGQQTWIFDSRRNRRVWLSNGEYDIVDQSVQHTSYEKDVDGFLKKQMDDNLNRVFR